MSFKNNEPLFVLVEIPLIAIDKPFHGTVILKEGKPTLWIEYARDDSDCRKLFSLVETRDYFTCFITYHNGAHLSMYQCFSITGFITIIDQRYGDIKRYQGPPYNTGFLEIVCNSWLEDFAIENTENYFSSFSISFPLLAPYLRGVDKVKIPLSEDNFVVFIHEIQTLTTSFPLSKVESENCLIKYVQKNKKICVKDAHTILLSIQTLMRYLSNLPIPLGEIRFFTDEKYDTGSIYHPNCGIKGINQDLNPNMYLSPTISFSEFVKTPNVLTRWDNAWDKNSCALLMYADCQNYNIPIDEKIIFLTKAFDELSSQFYPLKITGDKEAYSQWVEFICKESTMIQTDFEFSTEKLRSILHNANRCASLKQRLTMYAKGRIKNFKNFLKKEEDLPIIIRFVTNLRNSDSHASDFDIINTIPSDYEFHEIVGFMNELVKIFINEFILKIQITK